MEIVHVFVNLLDKFRSQAAVFGEIPLQDSGYARETHSALYPKKANTRKQSARAVEREIRDKIHHGVQGNSIKSGELGVVFR